MKKCKLVITENLQRDAGSAKYKILKIAFTLTRFLFCFKLMRLHTETEHSALS